MEFTGATTIIETYTASALTGELVLYTNQKDQGYSKGDTPYVKQTVLLTDSKQFELGRTDRAREHGIILFLLHARLGKGSAEMNTLQSKVIRLFRSKSLSGVTVLNCKAVGQIEVEGWLRVGLEAPFYYHNFS